MNRVQIIWDALIFAQGIVALPFVLNLYRNRKMIDLSKLQSQASDLTKNADALTTQAANSDDATVQAQLDTITGVITDANAKLAALVVPAASEGGAQ